MTDTQKLFEVIKKINFQYCIMWFLYPLYYNEETDEIRYDWPYAPFYVYTNSEILNNTAFRCYIPDNLLINDTDEHESFYMEQDEEEWVDYNPINHMTFNGSESEVINWLYKYYKNKDNIEFNKSFYEFDWYSVDD